MNYVRQINLSLKYQRFTSSDCKGIEIREFEFVTKTQFLSDNFVMSVGNKQTDIQTREIYTMYIYR